MTTLAKHIIVHGLVQGVGFRFFVQRLGDRLGLSGSVRNCPDTTVEITVEGDAKKVEEFIRQVEVGPRMARVERLEVSPINPTGASGAFQIKGW